MAGQGGNPWRWLAALSVILSATLSLLLEALLYFVVFEPQVTQDGQFGMIFPAAIAAGLLVGLLLAWLVIFLAKRKPNFYFVASAVGLVHLMFWALATVTAGAFLEGSGFDWLLTLPLLVNLLPMALCFLPFALISLPFALLWLTPLILALLIAYYFTPPRGFKPEVSSQGVGTNE
jgi:hypothetical protein